MNSKRIAVVGGGPGGYVAAIRASQLGAKVTLIEKEMIGGTCLNRGCIPTKALLRDIKHLRLLRSSPVFQSLLSEGFNPLEAMMDRKIKLVQELVKGVENLLESHQVTVKYAYADLSGANRVVLSNGGKREILEADAIILAMGSKPKMLPYIFPDGERIITSNQALEIKKVPSSIAIIGGGYIGVEFATIFNSLGSKVTIIEILDDILSGVEEELGRNLRRFLEREGVKILTKSQVEDLKYAEGDLRLTAKTPQGIQMVATEKILLAAGRVPNLDLDFSEAGVEISDSRIRVNRQMETSTPNIYAIGDVLGETLLAHVAMGQGVVAAENAMGMGKQMEDILIPLCIFTYPEIASVGLTEKEASAKKEIRIGRFPFRFNPAALISGETDGHIKVIIDQGDDKILGVHIIGHEATTLIAIAACLMTQGIKAQEFYRFFQAHPTTPEALKEAILDAKGMAIHLPKPMRIHTG